MVKIFAIRDKKADSYMVPFFQHNAPLAMRSVAGAMMDDTTSLAQYPDDFDLYELGTYDDQSGELVGRAPQFICSARSLVIVPVKEIEDAS